MGIKFLEMQAQEAQEKIQAKVQVEALHQQELREHLTLMVVMVGMDYKTL